MQRKAPLPLAGRKPWSGATASFFVHGLLVAFVVLSARQGPGSPEQYTVPPSAQQERMMYLPTPSQAPRPEGPIYRPPPDAVQAQEERAAMVRQKEDLPPAEQPPPEEAPPPPPEEEPVTETLASVPPPETPPEEPSMEAEAHRLFGRPRLQSQPEEPSTLGIRMGDLSDRDTPATRTCVPKPKDPYAPVQMAELIGRVWFDEAHTRPLSGAFLQMIGTPYSTYSDNAGRYRLVFDAALVDECRTQYVRVVAAGYSGKNLILGLGPGVNDIVMGR